MNYKYFNLIFIEINSILIIGGKSDENQKENKQLIVCLAYNYNFHYFSPVFFAILQSKTKKAYKMLHQQICLMRENNRPKLITVDFEMAHIEVCHKYFSNNVPLNLNFRY